MRSIYRLTLTSALALSATQMAHAQQSAAAPSEPQAETTIEGDIVVTARRREETLQDVPVAITAVSGDTIEQRGLTSVRDIAQSVPGLNINSDGAGRAFVAIRGVGVTLVSTVQPGVGLFVDGIYRPNTAYLNNPLLDVERVEVLRGPQGTLYGKNTLGGAINVITRQPGNELSVRGLASYAGPDDSWTVSGSVSAPLIEDKLAVRIAASHREQRGFLTNTVIGGDQNALETSSLNGTIRVTPSDTFTMVFNGYHDWIEGANTPYARVTGPRNYSRNIQFNDLNRTKYRYYGVNWRIDAEMGDSTLTSMAAYDGRTSRANNTDADFGPLDLVRSSTRDKIDTLTTELRLDSEWSEQFSTLVGLFYSNEKTQASGVNRILLFNPPVSIPTAASTNADTYAVFGTAFWRPSTAWEIALGLRYDHEDRQASGNVSLKSDEIQPRVSITRRWSDDLMTYATVARGYRGGGFNAPTAPTRVYKGDSAWSYELGSKYSSPDRRFNVSGALFYSDYRDYIGLNSVAPSSAGGLVTVDLNAGDVESYGAEIEAQIRPVRNWTLSGTFAYVHARLVDTTAYTRTTGRVLSSDRLTFQPDVSWSLNSDYALPIGNDTLTFTLGATGKGKRLAGTLNQTTPTFLDGYTLVNAQLSYRTGGIELAVFANNLLQDEYFDSYIEKTTLQLAGLPASDLGIVGDRRRIGARVRFDF